VKDNAFGATKKSAAAESRIYNSAARIVTLLVEAGPDEKFWQGFVHDRCRVRHQGTGGRDAALGELQRASTSPDAKMVAVLDADLGRVDGSLPAGSGLFWTDAHDLEGTLIAGGALEKLVLQTLGGEKRVELVERPAWVQDLRQQLYAWATPLGKLRWLKYRQQLSELIFKKKKDKNSVEYFDDYKKCVASDGQPSVERTLHAVISYSNAQRLNGRDLAGECAKLPNADKVQLCNGHDLLGFLRLWLHNQGVKLGEKEL
jgi:hypothetical protein